MKIIIKVLNGSEFSVEVPDSGKILDVRQQASSHLHITPAQIRFIFKGKPLYDDHTLAESGLVGGCKVFVTIKEPAAGPVQTREVITANLIDELTKFLRLRFSHEDAERVKDCFLEELKRTVDCQSLDDIERYARHRLQTNYPTS